MSVVNFKSNSEVELISFMGGDEYVAMSARVSFGTDRDAVMSDIKKTRGLIRFLMRERHNTPFESSVFTFRVKTPIFVAREFFRHRSASYNEWSGRYSEMVPDVYVPGPERPLVQKGKPGDYYFVPGSPDQYALVLKNYEKVMEVAWQAYDDMLEAGVAKEVARNILGLNTYTYFYVTMNARNLMHFLGLRNERHALAEIQEVARLMEESLESQMPLTYEAYCDFGKPSFDEEEQNSEIKPLPLQPTQLEGEISTQTGWQTVKNSLKFWRRV